MADKCTLEINSGKIQGYAEEGLKIFKGIPYAEPPDGDRRFRPAAPKKPWTGLLECLNYGPMAPQRDNPLADPSTLPPQNETDCLNLNVWTPDTDDKRRPVMFWIHGGGFSFGGGSGTDGANLARRGDVVVVTINYRVGILGYLYIQDELANLGQQDQITALEWVRDNIEFFGGDPENVTIFGESAGSVAVCTLMAMPGAKGLFRRVIAQSGACHPLGFTAEAGVKGTARIMSEFGFQGVDLNALRRTPVEKIVKVSEKMELGARARGAAFPYGVFIDGNTLPRHPLEAVRDGVAGNIELIIGTNQDEAKLYNMSYPPEKDFDEAKLLKRVTGLVRVFGHGEDKAEEIIETYRQARQGQLPTDPANLLDAISTDYRFRLPALLFAEAQSRNQRKVYSYMFTYQSPVMGGILGACHALEIPFVFGTLARSERRIYPARSAETDILSGRMMDAWTSFARSGYPSPGGPEWAPFELDKRKTMMLGLTVEIREDPFGRERQAWKGLLS